MCTDGAVGVIGGVVVGGVDVQSIRSALGDGAGFAVVEAVGTDVQQVAGYGRAVVDVVACTQVQRIACKQLATICDVIARAEAQAVAGADLSTIGDVFARLQTDTVVGANTAGIVNAPTRLQGKGVITRDTATTGIVDFSGADAERVNPMDLSAVVVNLPFDLDGLGTVEEEFSARIV